MTTIIVSPTARDTPSNDAETIPGSAAGNTTFVIVSAVGQSANLTFSPLEKVTTVTVQITMLILGDTEAETAAGPAYTLGFTLFVATLALNIFALKIVNKYRQKYD